MADTKPRCILCIYYDMENDSCSCTTSCIDRNMFKMHGVLEKHIKESETYDSVNPDHYNNDGIEGKDYIKALLGADYICFLIGNVIEHLYRYKHKNGVDDLRKASVYLQQAIEEVQRNDD